MSRSFQAIFCDGVSPVEETVEARFIEGQWSILRDAVIIMLWPMAELSCEVQAAGVLYTHRRSDATLLIGQGQELHDLPGLEPMAKVRGMQKKSLVVGLLLATVALVTVVITAMRPLSVSIAQSMSPERERSLFASMLPETFMDKHGCQDVEAAEILTRLGESLSVEERRAAPIDFLLLDWDMANAFALPGRKIAVTTGLLRKVRTSEQVAAILSHELGHVALRHNLSEFIRASLATFAWGVLVGDFSGAFVVDPSLMKQVGEMALSREAEEEADHYGAEHFAQAGYSPKALGSGLEAITTTSKGEPIDEATPRILRPILNVFSTHPQTAQRVAWFQDHFTQEEGKEPLDERSWKTLRTACAPIEKEK